MSGSGWNKGNGPKQTEPVKRPTFARGAIAGLIVISLAAFSAWLFLAPTAETVGKKKSPRKESRIQDAKRHHPGQREASSHDVVALPGDRDPQRARSQTVEMAAAADQKTVTRESADSRHDMIFAEENPCELYAKRPKYHIFKYVAENEIATLLSLQPGAAIIGEPDYSNGFMASFEACADVPMVFPDDDTEETKQLRLAVAEAKRELLERKKAGEDIAKVMADTRKELRQLWQYKLQLETEVREARDNEELSDDDVDDFIDAANKMLDDKGVTRINPSHFTRNILKYQMNRGIQQEEQNDEVD